MVDAGWQSRCVYWWLMAYDLTGFNPHHCRATETLEEMQEQSRSMLDIGLSDWLESNGYSKWKLYASG
jgi:hypothetical protein